MARLPRTTSLMVIALVAPMLSLVGPAAAAPACSEQPTYGNPVTDPSDAAAGFPNRRMSTDEINGYLDTVDEESDRVTTGTFGTSWNGNPLTYALVGTPENLDRVDRVAADQQRLRDPRRTNGAAADRIADRSPAIVWYSGNVHGNETSGADAAVSILYHLAARTDCEVEKLLDELVIGIMPSQNPDGRDAVERRNHYRFDLNRDWFARSQPETDGKLDLLSQYPPVLFVDAHEMGGSDFFFPPNADPIHHEVSAQSLDWINNLYGTSLADAFDDRGYPHFSYSVYDLFYMGYGDTVPTTAFTAAGMTFEKGAVDSDRQRWEEQFVAGWTSLVSAANHKDAILGDYYDAHVKALADGRAGQLEENVVVQPENEVQYPVPDQRIRHYFLLNDRAPATTRKLVRRLMSLGVEVHRLTENLRVPDLSDYGRDASAGTVPAGAYWVPMAQPQKRWVQALLGEDPYTPFPYFYDVTSWSNPLLMNAEARFSGEPLTPSADKLEEPPAAGLTGAVEDSRYYWFEGDSGEAVAAGLAAARAGLTVGRVPADTNKSTGESPPPGAFVVDASSSSAQRLAEVVAPFGVQARASAGSPPAVDEFRQPKIAVHGSGTGQSGAPLGESHGHLRFLLDRVWQVPYTEVNGAQIATGALDEGDYDVLLVGGASTTTLQPARKRIRDWIDAGGVYVGTARPGDTGGTSFAVDNGYTTAQTHDVDESQISGTIFRVNVDPSASPVTLGADAEAFWFNIGEQALTTSTSGVNAATYPRSEPDFFYSGFARGTDGLKGTAALVDEALGNGRVVLFSGEPNYRAYTESPAFFLANALAYPASNAEVAGRDVTSAALSAEVADARATAGPESGPGRAISIEVAPEDASRAEDVMRRFSDVVRATRADGSVFLRVPNPRGLDARDEHPFARKLIPALREAGVDVRSAVL